MPAAPPADGAETTNERWFTTTHWSLVLLAGRQDSLQAAAALEKLCRAYWYPLYAYVRRVGYGPDEAQDLTQEFFLRLLRDDSLARADPGKGRFRSFLLGAMNNFLAHEWRKKQALRRGGGQIFISLDDERAEARYADESASAVTPETMYDRRWALTLFDCALNRLQEEWKQADKQRQFERLRKYLSYEAVDGEYAALAAELQMTQGALAVAIHRLRQRYGGLVREEIAHTVPNPGALEDELRHLLAVLS